MKSISIITLIVVNNTYVAPLRLAPQFFKIGISSEDHPNKFLYQMQYLIEYSAFKLIILNTTFQFCTLLFT